MQALHLNERKCMQNAYMYVTMNVIFILFILLVPIYWPSPWGLHHNPRFYIKYMNCVVYISIKNVDVVSCFFVCKQ